MAIKPFRCPACGAELSYYDALLGATHTNRCPSCHAHLRLVADDSPDLEQSDAMPRDRRIPTTKGDTMDTDWPLRCSNCGAELRYYDVVLASTQFNICPACLAPLRPVANLGAVPQGPRTAVGPTEYKDRGEPDGTTLLQPKFTPGQLLQAITNHPAIRGATQSWLPTQLPTGSHYPKAAYRITYYSQIFHELSAVNYVLDAVDFFTTDLTPDQIAATIVATVRAQEQRRLKVLSN